MRLDRYELICPIAQGGMASVWIARQTGKHGFERLVAIKTILPKYEADLSFQAMFLDETRITSRIEHNNVARVLDVGEQHGTTYLVMEYVDGDALSTVHRTLKKNGERVPLGIVLRIMADVCGGLHAAHELRGDAGELLGVVHRDVSPHNILVSANGDAKLIDFGIAKARDRIAADTSTGTVKGKVRYMAPEQALGVASDRRADLWAIGAILYDILSGRPPYECENDVQTIVALTSGLPPSPLPATVPRPVAALVSRALEGAPENRFATAAEMQLALEDAMVAAKAAAGTANVAAFLASHLAERAQTRKEAIQLGLAAAADREKYASLMRSSLGWMSVTAGGSKTHRAAGAKPSGGDSSPPALSHSGHSVVTNGSLGSAAMGIVLRRMTRGRTSVRLAAAATLVGTAALATMAVRFSVVEPAPTAAGSAVAVVSSAPSGVADPVGGAARPSGAGSVAASDVYEAGPPPGSSAQAPTRAVRPTVTRATPQGGPIKGRAAKPRVDDGF